MGMVEPERSPPLEEPTAANATPLEPKIKRPKVAENGDATAAKPVAQVRQAPFVRITKDASERAASIISRILRIPVERPFEVLGIAQEGANGHDIRKAYRRIALLIHPDKNPGNEAQCGEALAKLQQVREQAENDLQSAPASDAAKGNETRSAATAAAATAAVDASFKCKYPGCDLPPCKQCANGCCTRNITHCHLIARSKAGQQCYFHPPPRAWARNAT